MTVIIDAYWTPEGEKFWTAAARDFFHQKNADDLLYIIQTVLYKKKINFPHLLYLSSKGIGVSIDEHSLYVLDADRDDDYKDSKDVFVFIGEMESTPISFSEYALLMGYLCELYIKHFPEDMDSILDLKKKIEDRYRSLSN